MKLIKKNTKALIQQVEHDLSNDYFKHLGPYDREVVESLVHHLKEAFKSAPATAKALLAAKVNLESMKVTCSEADSEAVASTLRHVERAMRLQRAAQRSMEA
jgi:hypothetical protein